MKEKESNKYGFTATVLPQKFALALKIDGNQSNHHKNTKLMTLCLPLSVYTAIYFLIYLEMLLKFDLKRHSANLGLAC